jgi:lipooligosaccharide transport system ATP-binding protein
VRFDDPAERDAAVATLESFATRLELLADRVVLYSDDGDHTATMINDAGVRAAAVLVRRASLEDVFLILTGRTLEEA